MLMDNAPAAALTHVTVLKTALMGLMNLVAVSVYSWQFKIICYMSDKVAAKFWNVPRVEEQPFIII